jgi:ethanolaminephosphotransferase
MSSTRCEVVNWLLVPLSAAVAAIFLSERVRREELNVLLVLTLVAIVAHVHYGVCVVRQMCRHFGIDCFSLRKRETALQDVRQKLLDRHQRD